MGYTRGHFSALVPMEPYARIDLRRDEPEDVTYLPLMDCESKLLPIHFLTQAEVSEREKLKDKILKLSFYYDLKRWVEKKP